MGQLGRRRRVKSAPKNDCVNASIVPEVGECDTAVDYQSDLMNTARWVASVVSLRTRAGMTHVDRWRHGLITESAPAMCVRSICVPGAPCSVRVVHTRAGMIGGR